MRIIVIAVHVAEPVQHGLPALFIRLLAQDILHQDIGFTIKPLTSEGVYLVFKLIRLRTQQQMCSAKGNIWSNA